VQTCKRIVFTLSGILAGLSGALYAFHEGFIGPGQLGPVLSTQSVLYVLFGGTGTLIGAVIGVIAIELVSYALPQIEWLGAGMRAFLETGWPIVLGLILLIVVMFRPAGLLSFVVSERERVGTFGRPRKGAAAQSTVGSTTAAGGGNVTASGSPTP
jgi:branched-chain amino acid transport system permease protein